MPLLNHRITYLPLLNAANRPAINQGDVFMNENMFTTNGAGRRQAWFEIDGVNGNDTWGRQTIFTNLPSNSVEAMTILENAFTSEYGGSTGSAVNIITKTGGDKFHGDVSMLFRPEATTAALSGFTSLTAANGNAVTGDSLAQPGLALSGPLGSKTRVFASTEFTKQNRVSPVTSPIAPGSFTGRYRGWLGLRAPIIRSTKATCSSSGKAWTRFTTPTPTASSAARACPPWGASFAAAPSRLNSARPPP